MKKAITIFTTLFLVAYPIFIYASDSPGMIKKGFMSAIVWIFKIPYWIELELASFMGDVLEFILSPSFVKWSYTGTDNPIIAEGLNVTQGLVNIFIILVLLVIVVSIILGVNEYGSKKMLVMLIIIALLVNFAPLLVGVMVDASNIMLFFFLERIEEAIAGLKSSMGDIGGKETMDMIEDQESGYGRALMGAVVFVLMQAFVLFVIAFVLFAYILLFILRYIAIWLLVILSPLAFVSLIHPITKTLWTQWFTQLTQWCLVGITGAFFLYLSLQVNSAIIGVYTQGDLGNIEEGFAKDMISRIFPMFVVAAFFVIGYITALKTSAIGADKAVNFAKQSRQRALKYGGAGLVAGAGLGYLGAKKTAKKGQEKWSGWRASANEKRAINAKDEKEKAKFTQRAEVKRATEKRLQEESIGKKEEKIKKLSPARQEELLLKELRKPKALRSTNKIKALERATSLQLKKPEKARKIEESINPEKVQKLIAQHGEDGATRQLTIDAVKKVSPKAFRENIDTKSLSNIDVFYGMDEKKINEIGSKGSSEQKEALYNAIKTTHRSALRKQRRQLRNNMKHKEADKLKKNIEDLLKNPDYIN